MSLTQVGYERGVRSLDDFSSHVSGREYKRQTGLTPTLGTYVGEDVNIRLPSARARPLSYDQHTQTSRYMALMAFISLIDCMKHFWSTQSF